MNCCVGAAAAAKDIIFLATQVAMDGGSTTTPTTSVSSLKLLLVYVGRLMIACQHDAQQNMASEESCTAVSSQEAVYCIAGDDA